MLNKKKSKSVKKTLKLSFFCIVLFLASCKKDNGEIITKEIKIKSFSTITNKTNAPVNITYGLNHKLEVTGNSEVLRKLKTKVKNDNLTLKLVSGNNKDYQLSFNITVPKTKKKFIKRLDKQHHQRIHSI